MTDQEISLKVGKKYRFKDGHKFPFRYEEGVFIGYTKSGWPRFVLNSIKGTECFINATDENFEEAL